jgi:hypothetical protein
MLDLCGLRQAGREFPVAISLSPLRTPDLMIFERRSGGVGRGRRRAPPVSSAEYQRRAAPGGAPCPTPPIYSFLGVPIGYQLQVYGWLCLVNKLGSDACSEVDERLAVTLAAQMAVAHENAQMFSNMQQQATELAQQVAERKHHEAVLRRSEQRYPTSSRARSRGSPFTETLPRSW